MSRSIIVATDEAIGCPKCGHSFPLSEGISRQAIEAKARASAVDEFSRREAQLKAQIESAQREAADLSASSSRARSRPRAKRSRWASRRC